MIDIIIGFFVNLLEKIGIDWWKKYESNEANQVQSKVNSMSDSVVADKLHKFERD